MNKSRKNDRASNVNKLPIWKFELLSNIQRRSTHKSNANISHTVSTTSKISISIDSCTLIHIYIHLHYKLVLSNKKAFYAVNKFTHLRCQNIAVSIRPF